MQPVELSHKQKRGMGYRDEINKFNTPTFFRDCQTCSLHVQQTLASVTSLDAAHYISRSYLWSHKKKPLFSQMQ